jgi:hypothetical protein
MLGIASLFAGAFISAIISGIPIENSFKSIIFYILSPMIAVGCGVAFFFSLTFRILLFGLLLSSIDVQNRALVSLWI